MSREHAPARLAAGYAKAVDDREFAVMETLMWPEFTQQGPGFAAPSREVFIGNLEFLRQFERTFHLVGQVAGEWDGDRYRGETYCVASHFFQREGRSFCLDMGIRYQDVIEVRAEGARYLSRDLNVVWQDEREITPPSFG